MKLFLRLAAIPTLLFMVSNALANAAPPRGDQVPGPPETAGMVFPVEVVYAKANGNPMAKIQITQEMLKRLALQARALSEKPGSAPLTPVTTPENPTTGLPHGGTIIAGLALSLAMVSMVYLMRRKPAHRWAVTGVAAVLLGLGVTSYLWADIRVPGQPYNGPARRPNDEVKLPPDAQSMVTIEIVEKGDKIVITVPPTGP